MAYYSKNQLRAMLQGTAPQNRGAVVQKLVEQGNQLEGFNAQGASSQSQPQQQPQQQIQQQPQQQKDDGGILGSLSRATQGFRDFIDQGAQKTGLNQASSKALSVFNSNPVFTGAQSLSKVGNYALPAFAKGVGGQLQALGDWGGVGSAIKGFGQQTENLADQHVRGGWEKVVGGGVGNIASQVPALATGAGLLNKIGGAGKVAQAGKFLGMSALGTETATAAGQGRLASAPELATGIAFDAALLGLGKGLKALGKGFQKSIVPLSPTQKALIEQRKIDLGQSLVDDIGVAKSKKDVMTKAANAVKRYDNRIKKILQNSNKNFYYPKLTKKINKSKYLQDLIRKAPVSDKVKIQEAVAEELAAAKKYLIGKSISKGALNGSDVLDIKRLFDGKINYDKLNPIANAKAIVNKHIADNARMVLDKVSPEITEALARQAPLLNTLKILKNKGGYSGYVSDMIVSGGAFSGVTPDGGITQGIKAALVAPFIKRLATSIPARTGIGTSLYKLGKTVSKSPIETSQLLKSLIQAR